MIACMCISLYFNINGSWCRRRSDAAKSKLRRCSRTSKVDDISTIITYTDVTTTTNLSLSFVVQRGN